MKIPVILKARSVDKPVDNVEKFGNNINIS